MSAPLTVPEAALARLTQTAVGDRCTCAAWADNIALVNAPFVAAFARNPRTFCGYTGEPFGYCPWCGSGLAPVRPTTRGDIIDAVEGRADA